MKAWIVVTSDEKIHRFFANRDLVVQYFGDDLVEVSETHLTAEKDGKIQFSAHHVEIEETV